MAHQIRSVLRGNPAYEQFLQLNQHPFGCPPFPTNAQGEPIVRMGWLYCCIGIQGGILCGRKYTSRAALRNHLRRAHRLRMAFAGRVGNPTNAQIQAEMRFYVQIMATHNAIANPPANPPAPPANPAPVQAPAQPGSDDESESDHLSNDSDHESDQSANDSDHDDFEDPAAAPDDEEEEEEQEDQEHPPWDIVWVDDLEGGQLDFTAMTDMVRDYHDDWPEDELPCQACNINGLDMDHVQDCTFFQDEENECESRQFFLYFPPERSPTPSEGGSSSGWSGAISE